MTACCALTRQYVCALTQDTEWGVCVCLHCFRTGCTGDAARAHAGLHQRRTGHDLAVRIQRTPRQAEPITKLAVVEKSDEETYEYVRELVCLACDPVHGAPIERTDEVREKLTQLDAVIQGIVHATSSAHKTEVQAWEEDIVPCEHTRHVSQAEVTTAPSLGDGATCAACELTSNLWMCLECGHLGCGRAQFGGVAGHGHALAHYEQTGHPCSVKQGTITPEGTADVYCYACNDARLDPELPAHLQRLGVPVASLSKTEKSMTELQLEQNVQFDFSMVGNDGQSMAPAYGPHRTGMQNLGNSCYMASTLQALFSLPSWQHRYDHLAAHAESCERAPHECLECQLRKLADGLGSGRYARGKAPRGIRPAMFKALVGRGNAEFASMRQQDADEFLQHLVSTLRSAGGHGAVTDELAYIQEHRLECTECHGVRYTCEHLEAGLGVPVPVRESDDGQLEPVTLQQSLDVLTQPESLRYHCPACQRDVEATKQTRFATLPRLLAVRAQRFQLRNWVPQKVDVPFRVPLTEQVALEAYLSDGLQAHETELPDDTAADSAPDVDQESLAMLISLGFPDHRARRALVTTNNDMNAAANWLFEHADDASLDTSPDAAPATIDTTPLEDMGFSRPQATKALRLCGQLEAAVAWLFEHPDDAGDTDDAPPPSSEPENAGTRERPARYELVAFVTHRGVRRYTHRSRPCTAVMYVATADLSTSRTSARATAGSFSST